MYLNLSDTIYINNKQQLIRFYQTPKKNMKQLINQSTSSDNTLSELQSEQKLNKRERIKKNVTIRKNKCTSELANHKEINSKIKLSKEEKYELQKIKNRQSAQRSRDMKKLYLEQLENQNNLLKIQIEDLLNKLSQTNSSKICSKCLKEVEVQQKLSSKPFQKFQEQLITQQNPLVTSQININDQDRYQRIIQETHTNKFTMFVFVVVAIIGVLVFDKSGQVSTPQILFDVKSLPHNYQNSLAPVQDSKQIQSSIALIGRRQETCLIQYLNERKKMFPQMLPMKNLRAKNPKYQSNDILYCNMPQIIKNNKSSSLISKNLEILMKGNELQYAFREQHLNYEVNPHNLYMVLVEVKDIVLYSNFQCLA